MLLMRPQINSLFEVKRISITASTLWIKSNPPNSNGTRFPHSMYLFPNNWSFINCDFKKAKRLENPSEGIQCKTGNMKFDVMNLKH
ncbi:hypothetical protein H5410_003197 [Solanum commersonii]|uniref:Uncharacterized protein n=1 Tax=Solanum commersonii TaxID=4109 RepID=A0A9J6B4D3_SOLCO|nr:hypothetical protein H5410_003197 [Solanum commersonii]